MWSVPYFLIVNLGGEGEFPCTVNQQPPGNIDQPDFRSSRHCKTLKELQEEGHQFVLSYNTDLPFADNSVDKVITDSVPIDTPPGLIPEEPGVQTSEIRRILKPCGVWIRDGVVQDLN